MQATCALSMSASAALPRKIAGARPLQIVVNHGDISVEPSNWVSKGGEHPLCDFLISLGVNTPAAKWRRL
jgi:hypothetical protein